MKRAILRLALLVVGLSWVVAPAGAAANGSGSAGEEMGTVIGVEASRSNGGFLGLAVEGNAFVLRFYDAQKQPGPVDALRAMVRWDSPQKLGKQRAVLNPSGEALMSPPVVRPPLSFIAFVTLIGANGQATESFSFNIRNL